MSDRHIVANRMMTPKGHVIQSHDYVTYVEDGVEYMVDGGDAYLRRSRVGKDCSVFSDDPFDVVREHLMWGTYGKNADEPFRRVPLSEMSDDHIKAVIDTQLQVPQWRIDLMEKELTLREEGVYSVIND